MRRGPAASTALSFFYRSIISQAADWRRARESSLERPQSIVLLGLSSRPAPGGYNPTPKGKDSARESAKECRDKRTGGRPALAICGCAGLLVCIYILVGDLTSFRVFLIQVPPILPFMASCVFSQQLSPKKKKGERIRLRSGVEFIYILVILSYCPFSMRHG